MDGFGNRIGSRRVPIGFELIDPEENSGELQPIEPATTVIVRPLPAGVPGAGNSGPPLEAHDPAAMVEDGDFLVTYFSGLEFIRTTTGLANGRPTWAIARRTRASFGGATPGLDRFEAGADGQGNPLEVGSAPGMDGPRTLYYTVTDWARDDGTACIGRATATGEFRICRRMMVCL